MRGSWRRSVFAAALVLILGCVPAEAANRMGVGEAYSVELSLPGDDPIRLHAEEAGAGRPLLLLHGLGASTFTWRRIAGDLARNHRVIALDLKGFGQSEKPLDRAYSAEDQAALVAAFIRKRGLDGITLVGHSFGGTVALLTALVFANEPARIERLVLLATPAVPQPFPEFAAAIETPLLPYGVLGVMSPERLARTGLTWSRDPKNPPSEADVTGYAAPFYDLGARHAFIETARWIVATNAQGYTARFRNLSVPSLLVWCRNDEIVSLSLGRKLARVLPNARLKVLRGCGHLPQDERPGALVGILKPFLR